jgi:biotin carboxyl carrier protein
MPTSKVRVTIAGHEFLATVSGSTVTLDGAGTPVTVVRRADGRYTITQEAATRVGTAAGTADGAWTGLDGHVAHAVVEPAGARTHARTSDDDALRPPMSATVVRLQAAAGATVAEGDVLIVLEAMKMELPIRAPRDGIVRAVHCREGELVQPSTVLLDLE